MNRRFIFFLLGCFVLIGGTFFAMLNWGSRVPLFSGVFSGNNPAVVPATPPPEPPKMPSVTLTVQKAAGGNMLTVQWQNLPGTTAALDIFRSTKGKNNWALWKTIVLAANELGIGSAQFNIGNSTFDNYSFYIEAVTSSTNETGSGGNPTNGLGQTILWISSSTTPIVTTSTPQMPQAPPSPTAPPASPTSSTSTAPNSPPAAPSSTPTSSSPSQGTGPASTTPPPPGIPYYTPQVQISGYGSPQAGTFWVQHVDQKIEIGWQNLPPQTTELIVSRAQSADGPWTAVLTQEDPSGSYSLQVVDNTLGQTYYYKLEAFAGTALLATYGPVTLPPVGQ